MTLGLQREFMTATLRAVAAAAGVHIATASRALNDHNSRMVNAETRQRVVEAATLLDYRPDFTAAALRSGRSRLVGILVPGLSNPVYAPIIAGAAEVLEQVGIGTMVGDTSTLRDRSAGLVRALAARRVDGLLMATAAEDDDLGLEQAMQRRIPLVLVNRSPVPAVSVRPDPMLGIGLAVDHLVGLGHRAIGYLGGSLQSVWRGERLEAFGAAMARHGLEPVVPAREIGGYGREAGRESALRLLAEAPSLTALVCGNDLIAVSVYDAARLTGRQVPRDLSVTGHNDIPFMDMLAPPLTTIRVDFHRLGAVAAELLLRRIGQEAIDDVLLRPQLMLRGSTAPPSGA